MTLRKLLFSTLLIFSVQAVFAQAFKGFTREPQAFCDEMYKIFSDVDKKDAKKLFDERFTPFWTLGNPYSEAERERIYDIADALQKKRFRPFPFTEYFLTGLMAFPGSPQEGEGFDTWLRTLDHLSGKSKKSMEDFLTMTHHLFADNTFYATSSSVWKSDNAGWQFIFEEGEYRIEFPNLNLICRAKGDSSVIYATQGTYFPATDKFRGRDGKITWERAEQDPNEIYAVITEPYELSMRSSFFTIDSVQFFNPFFSYPLLGTLEEKLLANVTPEKASYPRFTSFDKRLSIKNVVDNVNYNGGFRMEGANLKGSGSRDEPATLTFMREGFPQLVTYAQFYTIKEDRIASGDVKAVIMLNNDSIVHPSLQLRFNNDNRLLSLIKKDEGLSKSPYYDSYHNLDLYFEALYWNIDDPVIRMGNLFGSTETRAAFESSNYFKESRYRDLQGIDRIHPLFAIRQYARRVNSDVVDAAGLARHMGSSLERYTHILVDLTNKGFISYDIPNSVVEIRPKLYDYIAAAAGKIDYDVLLFNSDVADGKNAELNLVNLDLKIRGVERILVSDSQNVMIYPAGGDVSIRKNRDFYFGGIVKSGRFEFYGQEYFFNYDKFLVDLIAVDSCRLYVEDFRPERKTLRRVKNVIEGVGGTLEIDNPFNKSGLQEEYSEYPIFTCDRPSFVFYDNGAIQQGVYEREKVFFELEPFILDSLDNFAVEQIALEGRFVSGGIFPDLEETIGVQEDYSLGFVRSTPAEGLPLYGDKARFKRDIKLSFGGIQGDGELEFLTSSSASEGFTFFPDSTRGMTKSFVNEARSADPQVPEAHASVVDVTFLPSEELLRAAVVREFISMYDGQAELKEGALELLTEGLSGNGVMEFAGAELESDLITYSLETFDSDTAAFRLLALQEANLAFSTDNVNAHIDFAGRMGEFKSNGDETLVEFPVNEYICFMDEFKWYMDKNDISLETSREMMTDFVIDTELDMSRSNFFSVNKDQDSLNFMSPKAVYDLDTYTITADQIPWIRVADAKITPDSGRVYIRRKAKMDPLTNADILANYITQYHTIAEASVTIISRTDYVGSGDYFYIDENKQPQKIHMSSVRVDSSLQTVASGRIGTDQSFFLSPHFEFQGQSLLTANEKHLTFDGSTRIVHDCERLDRNWMKFKSLIDPEQVMIPVDTALFDDRGNDVEVGLSLTRDPYEVYGAFLSSQRFPDDKTVASARGYVVFNKNEQAYEVGDREKLKQKSLPGNYVSLHKGSCALEAQGKFEFGEKLGQFGLDAIGKLKYEPLDEKVEMNLSLALDFFFSDDAMDRLENYFAGVSDLKPVDFAQSNYEYAIRELMGLEESDKVIAELSLSGSMKRIPEVLKRTLFISDVKMVWDAVTESFVSKGDIGIATIGKNMFFRKVPGKIAVEKRASGDIVHIYFEHDDTKWYYFTYKRGLMQAYASDKEFNNILLEMKDDKRKKSGSKKEEDYTFMLGSKSKHNIFLDQFMF